MKFIFIFIFSLISGLSFGLKGSQHYKFNYFSSFKSEIPQDGDQASGVSLKAVLDVYLENNDGIAIFKLSDVTTVEFLEKLECDQDTEFSDDRFETPKDKVFLNALQQPFRVNLRGSQPFSIEYEETEERWLSNVRKGIASVFKSEILKGNFETQDEKDSISSLFHEGHLVNIFSVEEETIFGICKVTYEIHEINEGLITPENEFFPSLKIDSNEDLWRVVRSVDFDKCNEKVILNINSLNEKRNKGQKPKYTRSSVSTYLLSGSPGHFDLYGVVVEGVMTYPLSFFDEHEAHSSTKQKLTLIDQGPSEELPTLGPNLKQSTTWMYVVWSPFTQPKDSKPLPWIVYSDEDVINQQNEIHGSRPFTSVQISQLKVQILEDIETASKVLTDINYETKDSLWGTIPDTLNMVSYYFKMLSKKDIIKTFDHIYERKVKLEWRLIIDAAAASGSHNAFEAIFDYISADKLKPYQIRNVFLTLLSSQGTLNITRILDYVLHVNLDENEAGAAVWLNFAHYLKEFCIHKTHNYIPNKELFYEDCALVVGRFIQNLRDVIYNETLTWERTFAVKVLEVLQIDTSFNILTPLFNGTNKAPNELKAMALRALKNYQPDRDRAQSLLRKPAMDLLKEVYSDFNQDFQVRAAALLSFISWQPSTNFWNKLAQNTWNDPSKDFSSLSSNLISVYANKKVPALEKQWKDAYSASKLAKPSTHHYDDSSSSLFNFFFKDYAKLILGVNEKIPPSFENFFSEILTKKNDLSLLKFENYAMFSKASEMPFSRTPFNNEFFAKFLKEIGYDYNYYHDEFKTTQDFFQFLGGAINTQPSNRPTDLFNLEKDGEDENIQYGGRFLKFLESTDFFPNELGLPTFAFGSIPVTFSSTTKTLPRKPGQFNPNQVLVKASAIYTRGVGVYLPWSLKSHKALIRSSIELNIPVGIIEEIHSEKEGMVRTFKDHFNIGFEKKFPALRLSKTPMTITFYFDSINHGPVLNFVPIKKSDIEEKVISEVHPITGFKYDLKMKADTKSDFGLNDFLKFPKVPFGFWSFEFYINPEESETKEIIFSVSRGYLKKSEETTESFDSKQYLAKISNKDTFVDRSEKLTKAFGQSLDYFGGEFSFVGKKERNYEFFVTNTKGSNLTSRRMIGVTRSQIPGSSSQPASICFKMSKKIPSAAEMNSVFISKTNKSQEIKIKLLYNCSLPILKAHVLYSMSDEGNSETTKNCNSKYSNCKYDNIEFYSKRKLFYDTIDIDAFYATDTESFDLAVTENILDSLRNWVDLSSIKKFTDDTHHGNLTLRIHRNTYHKNWDIHLKTSSENVFLATYPDTPLFTFFSGVSQYQPISLLNMFNRDETTDAKCILQRNSVTTFDGVHYIYEPSTCWTLASHNRARWYRGKDRSVFLIRAAKEPSKILEFKYLNFALNLEIEFSNEELKVNGTVVDRLFEDSPDLRTIEEGIIYKIGHRYHIYSFTISTRNLETFNVQSPHIIVYEDKIEIYNENLKKSPANGICGNNDERMKPEFIGPKHCIYNNAQMFAASWTGPSDDCDAATLEEYRKGVDDFQADCKPYQKNIQDVQMNERCLVFQWKISTFNETNYCISAKPLPFCLEKCQTNKYKRVKVTYKCWPKANAPEGLIPLMENKNKTFVSAPFTAEPYFYEHSYEDVATFCKQF